MNINCRNSQTASSYRVPLSNWFLSRLVRALTGSPLTLLLPATLFLGNCGTSLVNYPTIYDVSFSNENEIWVVKGSGHLQTAKASPTNAPRSRVKQVDFVNPQVGWLFGQDGDVFSTSDGGKSWSKVGAVPGSHISPRMDFVNERFGAIATGSAFWVTRNSGHTWMKVFPTRELSSTGSLADTMVPTYSLVDGNIIWLTTQSGRVFITTNGGLEWNETSAPRPAVDWNLFAISEEEAWITGSGLFHTTDRGRTWEQVLPSEELNRLILTSISFQNQVTGWAFGFRHLTSTDSPQGPEGVAFKTVDGGITWQRLEDEFYKEPFRTVEFRGTFSGWMIGENSVYKTTDGGETWSKVFSSSPE